MSAEKFQDGPEHARAILRRMEKIRDYCPGLKESEPEDLKVPKSTLGTWRHRGAIPFEFVKQFAKHYPVSLDYLYFGLNDPFETEALKNEIKSFQYGTMPPPVFAIRNPVGAYDRGLEREFLISKRDRTEYVLLPKMAAKPSAGSGTVVTSEQIVAHMALEKYWYDTHVGIPYSSAIMMEIKGDSMSPDLYHGEHVIVDLRVNQFKDDAIYVFVYEGDLKIKRIHARMDGSIEIKSSNPTYQPEVVSRNFLDSLIIVGRPKMVFGIRELP